MAKPTHPVWCSLRLCRAYRHDPGAGRIGHHRSAARLVPPRGNGAVVATARLMQSPGPTDPVWVELKLVDQASPGLSCLDLTEARWLVDTLSNLMHEAGR